MHKERLGLIGKMKAEPATQRRKKRKVPYLVAIPAPKGGLMADTKIILTVPPGTDMSVAGPSVVCGPRILQQQSDNKNSVRARVSCDDIWGRVLSQAPTSRCACRL